METKIELIATGVNELEEKIKKAQELLSELKKMVKAINDSQLTITLKPS